MTEGVQTHNIAFVVNMSDDSYKILHLDGHTGGKEDHFANFTEAKNFFYETTVHPADLEFMKSELELDNIKKKIKEGSSCRVKYRVLLDGITYWHEMTITAINSQEVAISFVDKNLEITKQLLEEKRYEDYLALYVVDLDTGMSQTIKASPFFSPEEADAKASYPTIMKRFATVYTGEPRDFFTKISDLDYVREEFASEDKISYVYKTTIPGSDKWIEVVRYVTDRHADGTPAMFAMSFSMIDTLATAQQEVQARLKENMEVIGGLASEYQALYYYNITDGYFKVYSLDEKKFPSVRKLIEAGGSPLDMFYLFGASDLIHPNDRHLFAELNVDKVKNILAHSRKFTARFRCKFGHEYHWTELDIIKYGDIDEPANAIAVGFADRDADIRGEQTLNKCFEVFSKDISPAAAINELLSVAGEFYGADRCHVFEYSQNKGNYVNTYEWCAEGIEEKSTKLQNVDFEEIAKQLNVPMTNGEETEGYICIDNPTKGVENQSILKKFSVIVYSEILKRKQNDEEHVTLEKITDTFVSVYYVDLSRDYIHTWKIDDEYREAYGAVTHYSTSMQVYVRENIAERDRERCIVMTSPEYVLEQFKTKDRFSIEMTDIMLGYERNVVFDYVKVNDEGNCFVICCRDVTESLAKEREQKRQFEIARNEAEAASRSKTSFLFNMSHDIRTPMNAIIGFSNMAQKNVDNKAKVTDYLGKISTSGQQLLLLINQVLEMARIESGKIELEEAPIDVMQEYQTMITVLAEQAKTNGLKFTHSMSDVSHYYLYADQARMSSITLNIAGNAMKYTPKGGKIEFALKELPCDREGYARMRFTVSDNGIGMSEEYQKVLFEPFTRENSSTVSKIQGTGLGMSIVKDLVELMGGKIDVHSEPNKGTRFDITIDFRIDDEEHDKSEEKQYYGDVSFEGLRVLVVEDNELNREIAVSILDEKKMLIEEACDGTEAVELLKKKGPDYYDIVLMDIQMPIMNGYEATKKIRAMYPKASLPIIALSANAFSEDRENSIAAGMSDHVSKPINVDELYAAMARVLDALPE